MRFHPQLEWYCKINAEKSGVPLYLKLKVKWDTSFGKVGHGHNKNRTVKV